MTLDELTEFEVYLEKRYNQNQLLPRLKEEIKKNEKIVSIIQENNIPEEFGIMLIVQVMLHKRIGIPTIVGILRHYYESAQDVMDMIDKCIDCDLVDYDVRTKVIITKYLINSSLQLELDRFQFPMPMVIVPKALRNNFDTGYLDGIKSSVILKDNYTDDDVCLDHLNKLNKIPLMLDMDTAYFIKNKWKGLDHKKADEDIEEFEQRTKNFAKYNSTCLWNMELLHDKMIYMTHAYDKRGRTYCRGYHVNPQGNTWNKAVIRFAHGEYVK